MKDDVEALGNPGEISRESAEFATWFATVWSESVGPIRDGQRRRYLDAEAFLRTMGKCLATRHIPGGAPDPRTVDNWRKAKSLPREQYLEPLLETLLGGRQTDHVEWVRGEELWRAAETRKNQAMRDRRRGIVVHHYAVPTNEELPGESDWKVVNTQPVQEGLAELLVHPPPRGGNTPFEIPLRISLSFAEWPDEVEGAILALTDATLIPTYTSCRPAPGSRLAEGAEDHKTLLFRGGTWRIKGPRLSNNHLQGEPLAGEVLCSIQCDGEPGDSVALLLRSGYRSFVVVPDDPNADANVVKQRILQALVQKYLPRDREGVVTWGISTLQRKNSKCG